MIVKQPMAITRLSILIMLLLLATNISAADEFTPYLGLALPYPQAVPQLHMERLGKGNPGNIDIAASLEINASGKIEKVTFPEANREMCSRFEKDIKEITMAFLPGTALGDKITVPIKLHFIDRRAQGTDVQLLFPVDSAITSQMDLLYALFKENHIAPPAITSAPDINFTPPKDDSLRVDISTAVVSIDSSGHVENVTFPLANQRRITHQTLTALIHSTIAPFKVSGQARPVQFIVTFRYFDELDYPLNPITGYAADSLVPYAFKYFMNIYFNFDDITNPALPRNHPAGVMGSAPLGRQLIGDFAADIRIDPSGEIQATSIPGVSDEEYKLVRKCVSLFEWYPAYDNKGNPVWFSGRLKLRFSGNSQVVYIPEWLE